MVAPLFTSGLRNLLLAAETFLLLRLWWLCAENNRTAGARRQIKDPKKHRRTFRPWHGMASREKPWTREPEFKDCFLPRPEDGGRAARPGGYLKKESVAISD